MNRYRHRILGFLVWAAVFPNGFEDGSILERRENKTFPARIPNKFFRYELLENYTETGYWIRIDGKIFDVHRGDYLVIRGGVRWIEKQEDFENTYRLEVVEDEE